jgi:CheY-like chemotaxis protein
MDHMMPKMDGMEAMKEMRALGYNGVIIALTANAIVGNEEMFVKNGFDGFLSKPIDTRKLDTILNKFLSHKNSEVEAPAPPPPPPPPPPSPVATEPKPLAQMIKMNARLLNVLRNDVKKAIVTMRETIANGDIKLYTTTVHGLKSALQAIGEEEKAQQAIALELAGRNNETEFINANTEIFIESIQEFLKDEH